jgi:hypothetical protein
VKVLVVARTRMGGDRVCVGGIDLDSGASVRLLGSDTQNLLESHPIRPGDIWNMTCSHRREPRPPHVEDVVVTAGKRLSRVANLRGAILELVEPWDCELDEIFDGRLAVTDAGTAFLRDEPPLPDRSVGFWAARTALRQSKFDESGSRYWIPEGRLIRKVKYVGMHDPTPLIPEGALVRFSLARWHQFPPGVDELRCYLQLSGWYA